MNRRGIIAVFATIVVLSLSGASGVAQQKTLKAQLVGTWTLISFDSFDAAGKKVPTVEGGRPKGLLIFTEAGRMSLQVIAPIPKLASNNRLETTPAEDKAIAHATLAYFGAYTVNEADKTITTHIEGSSFPNQMTGGDAVRKVTFNGDELTIEYPRRNAGGRAVAVWRRVA